MCIGLDVKEKFGLLINLIFIGAYFLTFSIFISLGCQIIVDFVNQSLDITISH